MNNEFKNRHLLIKLALKLEFGVYVYNYYNIIFLNSFDRDGFSEKKVRCYFFPDCLDIYGCNFYSLYYKKVKKDTFYKIKNEQDII